MINPVKSFLTHGPLILKEIYTNKFQKYTHTISQQQASVEKFSTINAKFPINKKNLFISKS